jgi:hypothetical protein
VASVKQGYHRRSISSVFKLARIFEHSIVQKFFGLIPGTCNALDNEPALTKQSRALAETIRMMDYAGSWSALLE